MAETTEGKGHPFPFLLVVNFVDTAVHGVLALAVACLLLRLRYLSGREVRTSARGGDRFRRPHFVVVVCSTWTLAAAELLLAAYLFYLNIGSGWSRRDAVADVADASARAVAWMLLAAYLTFESGSGAPREERFPAPLDLWWALFMVLSFLVASKHLATGLDGVPELLAVDSITVIASTALLSAGILGRRDHQQRDPADFNENLLQTANEDPGSAAEVCLLAGSSGDASISSDIEAAAPGNSLLKKQWLWWLVAGLNIFLVIAGQTTAVLLGRIYYDQGGNSKWVSSFVQTAGFPLLFIALYGFGSKPLSTQTNSSRSEPPIIHAALIYIVLGLVVAADNLMYSYGLLYLPASTYSLICASQLAFSAIFSCVLNAQKITPSILNSIIILTFSSSLLGVREDSKGANGFSHGKFVLGLLLTLGASATYSLILSLMQLAFEKTIKRKIFSTVLDMQIYTSLVATVVSLVGLFASGEWKTLEGEMLAFRSGKVSYIMTLMWTAISWQLTSVGVIGLIFMVSSLFSNVISTLALPITPVFAILFFHDNVDGIKIISMLVAIWGFISYGWQLYEDGKAMKTQSA